MNNKKTLLVFLSLSIIVVVATFMWLQFQPGYVYRVYVDGEDIGTVADLEEYKSILENLLQAEEASVDLNLDFAQEITAQREFHWSPQANAQQVQGAVEARVSYITVGCALVVNGETLLWTSTEDCAQEALETVSQYYNTESSACELVSTEIVDDVEIRSEPVLPEDVIDVDTAVALITQGREKVDTYTVSRGDSLWSIARSASISESELREANPSLQKDAVIQPGQKLNLVSEEPQITVKTVEDVHTYESIPFSTSYSNSSNLWYYQSKTEKSGVPGKREVTYRIEYINGVEQDREVLDSQVVSEPVTRIVQRGTSRWPSAATGMFRWPLNSGTITDRFGSSRRGYRHRGVDIGAGYGTNIYAAASGTVVTSSYGSSYGNYVKIDHGNGYSTLYAHASSLLVSAGQRVSKGQVIARVGSTGVSTGNHLHFEVQRRGTPINPLQFFKP